MDTITVGKLKELLDMVPDDSPVYIHDDYGTGIIGDVSLHCDGENQFAKFTVKIDYTRI